MAACCRPEQDLTALTQYRLASSIEERLQDERMLVSVYSPQCPPHATVSRGQAQTFYGIFGSRLLDWQAQKRWLELQKEVQTATDAGRGAADAFPLKQGPAVGRHCLPGACANSARHF